MLTVDLSQVRRLIMDEFALFKRHSYAAIAICADTWTRCAVPARN